MGNSGRSSASLPPRTFYNKVHQKFTQLFVNRLLSVAGEANPLWQDLFSFGGDEQDDDFEGPGEEEVIIVDGIERTCLLLPGPCGRHWVFG